MTDVTTDETGWRRLAAALTNGAAPGTEEYAEPFVDRHPPYASGSFHDGWVRVCIGRDREMCRIRPERDGRRNTEFAAAIAAAGPALHAAADEVARLRARVAELERLLAQSQAPTAGGPVWRADAGSVSTPHWAGSMW